MPAGVGEIIPSVKRTAIGAVLSFLSALGGAAPPDPLASKAHVVGVMPASIDSEASLEYFIAVAARIQKGDTSKDLGVMALRLESLKTQKRALQQKILEKERELTGAQAGAAAQAARAECDALKTQLANVELAIKNLVAQIQRLEDEQRREQDQIKAADDALSRLLEALANAELRRTEIAGAISSTDAFAKRLSPAKKRETEDRVRRAHAQLAEARRQRLSVQAPAPVPAFRIAPR